MCSGLPEAPDPPLGACQRGRIYLELAHLRYIRRSGFQAADVGSMGKLSLQVATNDALGRDQFSVLREQFRRRL
jgi:hypothetical protein